MWQSQSSKFPFPYQIEVTIAQICPVHPILALSSKSLADDSNSDCGHIDFAGREYLDRWYTGIIVLWDVHNKTAMIVSGGCFDHDIDDKSKSKVLTKPLLC